MANVPRGSHCLLPRRDGLHAEARPAPDGLNRRAFLRGGSASLLFPWALAPAAYGAEDEIRSRAFKSGGPYVPTPQLVVDEMLKLASVGAQDYVVDLGSGDGVIVLTAARKYGARGLGVDIDGELVRESNAAAARAGLADRARFVQQDIFQVDTSAATVVTLYLLPQMMLTLRPKLLAELRPGTRIVAHDYDFGSWDLHNLVELDVPEKEAINGVPKAYLRLWIMPAHVHGRWQVTPARGDALELTLRQRFQSLDGYAIARGREVKLTQASIRRDEISFALLLDAKQGPTRFTGRVSGTTITGNIDAPGRPPAAFTAQAINGPSAGSAE